MNNDWPLEVGKKRPAGREARISLLRAAGFEISSRTVRRAAKAGVGQTDVLDAYAACWTAARIARNQAERLGDALHRRPVPVGGIVSSRLRASLVGVRSTRIDTSPPLT